MARYNEILVGRFNRALQKLLQLKGDAPAPQLASDIQANLSFPIGVEFRYLEGWNRYGLYVVSTAAAGNGSAVKMRNPPNSNIIVVVERLTLHISSALPGLVLSNGASTVDLATPVASANARLDPRGGPASGVVFTSQNTVAGLVGDLLNVTYRSDAATGINSDVILTDNQEIPLLPGEALNIVQRNLNNDVNVCFLWRERFLEDSERA